MKLTQEEVQWLKLAGFEIQLPKEERPDGGKTKDEKLHGLKTIELLLEVVGVNERSKTADALKGLALALEGSTTRAVKKLYKKRHPQVIARAERDRVKNEIAAEAKPLAEKLRAFAEELAPEAKPK